MELLLPLLVASAHAGGWTRDKGQYYVKAGADVYVALTYVEPGTDEPVDGSYFGQQYGAYAEVGLPLPHPVQVSASAPLVIGTATGEGATVSGPLSLRATTVRAGDLRLAAQTALTKKAPLAAGVEVKIPLYDNTTVGEDFGAFADVFPEPGDGQVDGTAWLFAGASPSSATFVQGALGYRHRWDASGQGFELVDGIPFAASGGVTTGSFLWMAQVDGIANLVSDETTRQYLSVGPAAMWTFTDGLALELRGATELWARNASRGIGAGIGLSARK